MSERKLSKQRQQRAVEAVAAYLGDRDPDIYNWLDEAVRDDAMGAAWTLTRLAATAIADLLRPPATPLTRPLQRRQHEHFPTDTCRSCALPMGKTPLVQRSYRCGLVLLSLIAVGCSGSSSSSNDNKAGEQICRGVGSGSADAYRQTADFIPKMRSTARKLSRTDRWRRVGQDYEHLADLGPTAQWSSTDAEAARAALSSLTRDCRGAVYVPFSSPRGMVPM